MIVVRLKGGLGNQMFQYATAYSLSRELKQPLKVNMLLTSKMSFREYRLTELKIDNNEEASDLEITSGIKLFSNRYINKICRILNIKRIKLNDYLYFLETRDEYQTDLFDIQYKNIYLDGYFQTDIYFSKYRDRLLEQYVAKYDLGYEYSELLNKIKMCNSVAVHVRRGDFKKDKNVFHYLLDADYYYKAIEYVSNCVEDAVFFWFSDDKGWVVNQIGKREDFIFVDIKSPRADIIDLMLMKYCKHIIAANSTFSWWASWLNENEDALHIVPKRNYGMKEMIPKDWIRL